MTKEQTEALRRHFLEWSGGFEPESKYQITVYIDYARDSRLDQDEVRVVLENYMNNLSSIEIGRNLD
jgi:hypothetical protein